MINILYIEFLKITAGLHLLPTLQSAKKTNRINPILLSQKQSQLTKEAKKLGIKTYEIDFIEFNIHKLNTYKKNFKIILLMINICKKESINIIHSHRLNWAYLGIITSTICQIPIIIDIVIIEKLSSKFQNTLLRLKQNVIYLAISENTKYKFISLYKKQKAHVIVYCSGLNITYIKENSLKKIKHLEKKSKTKLIVAMISRMDPQKGVETFIESAAILLKKYPDLHFTHIGNLDEYTWGNNYFKKCQKLVSNLKISKNFYFEKYTFNILNYYKYFFCTVLPTKEDTLGYVTIESLINNIPTIITNVDGTAETVNNGKAGILLPYSSPNLFASAIEKLILDDKFYKNISNKGIDWIQKKFNSDKNIIQLEKIYKNTLDF